MIPRTVRVFTRDEITAAIQAADLDIPAEAFFATRVPFERATCLALRPGSAAELLSFYRVVAGLLADGDASLDLASIAVDDGWKGQIVLFPGYVLDEPTEEEKLYLPDDEDLDAAAEGAQGTVPAQRTAETLVGS